MRYEKSNKYDIDIIKEKIMGPNPIKLTEELLTNHNIAKNATVMDLGSGQGVTSVFLAKEYGFRVFATDLWSNPTDNKVFFEQMDINSSRIIPICADANKLPYAEEFFDSVVCVDSYNYFGRNDEYLEKHLLPYVKHGGYIYIVIPGMKKDCHENLPSELLISWTPEQLDYLHDIEYWKNLISKTDGIEIKSIHEMESNKEVWQDWIMCDNEYARLDKKSIDAGGLNYLNFIAIVIKRK